MAIEVGETVLERKYVPTKKQNDFLSIPFEVKEALYGGAAGSGKTDILVIMPLIYQFHEHPLYKGLLLRRHLPELEKEIIARSKEIFPSFGAIYNETKKFWKFPSGAREFYGAADKEDDIRKFDSDQYNLLRFDEATHFTEFQYPYLSFSRVRSRTSDLPAIIRSGTNPGNVGHSYFKKRFVTPWKHGYKKIVDKDTGLIRMFIPARITDNRHLLDANPEYIQQLSSLPEAEKKAKLYGDWDTFQGQVFQEWRLEPLSDEPPNACHIVKPFDIPIWWPRFVGIDWGWEAWTVIYWSALSPNGRLYIYREYAAKGSLTDNWLAELINLSGEEIPSIKRVRICHSATQHRGEPSTIFDKLSKAIRQNGFKCSAELGEKNRINGKLLIHDFLRWQALEPINKIIHEEYSYEKSQQILRLYGQQAYIQYSQMFEVAKSEEFIPRLQVLEGRCPLLVEAIPNCIYEEAGVDGKKPEDVAEFDGDDPYDCLRILLAGVKDFHVNNAKEMEALKETENAIAQLAKGDQTAFYRRMEKLEAEQGKKDSNSSIRRVGFRGRHSSRMQRMHR